jgi:hypothetical protein
VTFDRFATALFFVAVATTACLMPAQSDTWWQLRAGQYMLTTGSVPLRDTFSHSVNGGYWPNHEWLSQVILYGVYRIGGLPGLTGFAAAVVTASWCIVWRVTPGTARTRLGLSALAVGPFATEWSLRPQIFTLLCMAATVWLLVHRRYFLLPPLFAVWANLHGGVMLGGLVVASHALASVVSERRLWTRPMVAGGLCALMTGVTPLGFSLWTEVPAMLGRLRDYGVLEWRPPSIQDRLLAPFWLMCATFSVLSFRRKVWREDPAQSLTVWGAAALLPVAVNASRNIPAALLLMVPALGTLMSGMSLVWDRPRQLERPAFNRAALSIGCLAAIAAVVLAWSIEIPKLQWRPLPPGVIAAVRSCPDSIYNRYDEGGFLIWFVPERKVFIDSRQDPYPAELVREHIRVETTGDYTDLFARYSIRCALVLGKTVLGRRLAADGWWPLYQDDWWTVLASPPSMASSAINMNAQAAPPAP